MEVYVLVAKEKSLFIKTTTLAFFVMAAMSTLYVVLGYIAFFPMALLTWVVTFVLRSRYVEYEYSYYDGELRFAKIVNKKRRKELETYLMEEVITIAHVEDMSIYPYLNDKNAKVRDYTTGRQDAKVYVAVVKNANGIELVTYEPDEKYISEVCIKYGYKVKRLWSDIC